ncbi:MAG: nitrilase-related carbon-nitrogen hydrolase [Planctomycetota bacterium]
MKVGLGQIECVVGDVAGNVEVIVSMIGEAAAQRCDVVWFPELADTGYALSTMRDVAGAWSDREHGEAFASVSAAAKRHGIAVGCGLSERVGQKIYNSLAVFDACGALAARYRKVHLFCAGASDESACFVAGDATQAVELGGITHGLSVCYDLRFPELYRKLADVRCDVLVNATAWPSARPTHWDVLTRARAIENQAWFVGVARVGCDEGIAMNGLSRVVDPMGEVVVEGSGDRAELLVAEIDRGAVTAFRGLVPALRHRRPDVWA